MRTVLFSDAWVFIVIAAVSALASARLFREGHRFGNARKTDIAGLFALLAMILLMVTIGVTWVSSLAASA